MAICRENEPDFDLADAERDPPYLTPLGEYYAFRHELLPSLLQQSARAQLRDEQTRLKLIPSP